MPTVAVEAPGSPKLTGEEGRASPQAAQQPGNVYTIRPNYKHKFRPPAVKEVIRQVLNDKLSDKTYKIEEVAEWTRDIADEIKRRLKEMGLDRYKFVVQVVIGEQRGQGVKMGCRCFWDSDTDNYAEDAFLGTTLWCVATAFGLFHY
eukprot:Opistho-1_new@48057